jgi:hypothetical protein
MNRPPPRVSSSVLQGLKPGQYASSGVAEAAAILNGMVFIRSMYSKNCWRAGVKFAPVNF